MTKLIRLSLFAAFALCVCALQAYASEIDSIRTIAQLNKFMVSRVDSELANVLLSSVSTVDTSSYPYNSFFKIDINHDGRNDLIVITQEGGSFFAVMDKGDSTYDIVTTPNIRSYGIQYRSAIHPLLDVLDYEEEILFITQEQVKGDDTVIYGSRDTVVFRLGAFISYNPTPDTFCIDHIAVRTGELLFGAFDVDLHSSLRMKYVYPYQDNLGDTVVSVADFQSVSSILNYIGFSHSNGRFSRDCDDCGLLRLTVAYCNGNVKTIEDYGMQGTPGLRMVYRQLMLLCSKYKTAAKDEKSGY